MRLSVTRPLLWDWWEEPLWETVHRTCSAGKNQPFCYCCRLLCLGSTSERGSKPKEKDACPVLPSLHNFFSTLATIVKFLDSTAHAV